MNRLLAIIKKEFIQMKRDRMTFALILMMPLVQLIVFGYAINTDVKHLPMAVYDLSNTEESRRLIQAFTNSDYFNIKYRMNRYSEINDLIDRGKVKVGLIISPDYEKDLKRGLPARAQVIVDASDPMVASSTLSNAQGISTTKSMELLYKNLRPGSSYRLSGMPVDIEIRGWYNPDLVSAYYIVPGLIGVILCMMMMMMTSMAIVRERETGTLEQLITTPIRSQELMIGKIVPYILVGYTQMTIALLVGKFLFRVPIRGNLLLLYAITFVYIVCYLGVGLMISTITRTQQQAMQMSFFLFLPTILLSGFMFPRAGMPLAAQYLGFFMPLTYFLEVVRGIILKGVGLKELWQFVWPLLIFMFGSMTVVILRFKKNIE